MSASRWRFSSRARVLDGLETNLAPLEFGRNVQLGLVSFSLVGGLGALQQGIDLGLQSPLGLLHALVAHRLVAARVGLELDVVDDHHAQLDQPHLAGQANPLHEQVAQR